MQHSIYVHIPFCVHRCAYCDFNTYAGQQASIPAYVQALCREFEYVGSGAPAKVQAHTVFFGGGTPSLLSPEQFEAILNAIRTSFDLSVQAEVTMEANPGTVSYHQLRALRSLGVNRISYGAQSANTEELRMLERAHGFLDVIDAVASARKAGFDNLNLDLIYGLPEQTLESWQTTVRRVLDLHPDHLSAYALTLEHGTPFGRWATRGLLPIPDPDLAADMYEWASGTLADAGYVQYEISNWGREIGRQLTVDSCQQAEPPGYACRHNLQYWRCLPYLGFGAGAHGYAHGRRYSNVLRIKTYIERVDEIRDPRSDRREAGIGNRSRGGAGAKGDERTTFPLSPAAVNQHTQTQADEMAEYMITRLRLTREGVSATDFRGRFGRELAAAYPSEIAELTEAGLLEWNTSRTSETGPSEVLRLTGRGRLLGNRVFMRFV